MITVVNGKTMCELCGWYVPPGYFRVITVNDDDEEEKDDMAICTGCAEKVELAR